MEFSESGSSQDFEQEERIDMEISQQEDAGLAMAPLRRSQSTARAQQDKNQDTSPADHSSWYAEWLTYVELSVPLSNDDAVVERLTQRIGALFQELVLKDKTRAKELAPKTMATAEFQK